MVAKVARHFISNVRIQISFLGEHVGKSTQQKSGSRGFWSYTLVSFNGTFFFFVPTEVIIFILNHHHPPKKNNNTRKKQPGGKWFILTVRICFQGDLSCRISDPESGAHVAAELGNLYAQAPTDEDPEKWLEKGVYYCKLPLKMPALQICRESCVFPDFGVIFCRNFMPAFFFQHIMLEQPLVAWQEREKATTTQTVEAHLSAHVDRVIGAHQTISIHFRYEGLVHPFTLSMCRHDQAVCWRFFFLPQVTRSTSSFQPDRG